jgi:hypothetical protein
VIGAGVADDEFAGACTPDPSSDPDGLPLQGSCAASTDRCAFVPGETGICVRQCEPATTYVSTGDCPSGSRCFTVDAATGNAFCFPDCETGSDCTSGSCDAEGGCIPPGA